MADPAPPIRIALDEAAFRDLVAGRVVKRTSARGEAVELILSDIGWHRMHAAIRDAMKGKADEC